MGNIFRRIICLFCCAFFLGQAAATYLANGDHAHLDEVFQLSEPRHDNIDDSASAHTHKHRHNEDGEEHDHSHEHSNAAQSEIKIVSPSYQILLHGSSMKVKSSFVLEDLISDPHPFEVFRPPIS